MNLKVLDGPDRGKMFAIREGDTTIGRVPIEGSVSADIAIADPLRNVSISHATLKVHGNVVAICDHSKNGTFINGRRATESQLRAGDLIKVGLTTLQLCDQAASDDEPTAVRDAAEKTRPREVALAAPRRPEVKKGSEPYRVAAPSKKVQTTEGHPGVKKSGKTRRLMLVGLLVFAVLVAIMIATQMPKTTAKSHSSSVQAQTTTLPALTPAVPLGDAYSGLDTNALPESVKQLLEQGKNDYDYHVAGSWYQTVCFWQRALSQISRPDHDRLEECISAVKGDLLRKFRQDSMDVVRLIKQGNNPEAASRLNNILDEFPCANSEPWASHPYDWASTILSRYHLR
jgi:hypothetical protein